MEGGSRTTKILGLVHCDVYGWARTTSLGRVWYFLTFINDYSKKTLCYFLKGKGECFSKFLECKVFVET